MIRYLCSLLAGASISLALLLTADSLVSPVAATVEPPADPFAVFDFAESAPPGPGGVYNDGIEVPAGAWSEPPAACVRVTVARPICARSGWWTRGPVRRVVSYPVRRLIGRVRCR